MALVELAKIGDGEAFAELYARYFDVVHRYIRRRTGSRELAEDLTSETFTRALRRIDSFTWQGKDFGAWLITIACNISNDRFKSSSFRFEVATSEISCFQKPDPNNPEDLTLKALTRNELLAAVQSLSAEQQECIILRFFRELSLAETARIMGKRKGAVKTLQYRAIRNLEKSMLKNELAP